MAGKNIQVPNFEEGGREGTFLQPGPYRLTFEVKVGGCRRKCSSSGGNFVLEIAEWICRELRRGGEGSYMSGKKNETLKRKHPTHFGQS